MRILFAVAAGTAFSIGMVALCVRVAGTVWAVPVAAVAIAVAFGFDWLSPARNNVTYLDARAVRDEQRRRAA